MNKPVLNLLNLHFVSSAKALGSINPLIPTFNYYFGYFYFVN